jgi:hypothetical protein
MALNNLMLMSQLSQINAMQQPQIGANQNAALKMISQLQAMQQPQIGVNQNAAFQMINQLQAVNGAKGRRRTGKGQKGNAGIGLNHLIASLKGVKGGINAGKIQKGNARLGLNDLIASLTGKQGREDGSCIWVSGLPEEYQDSQKLLNIFGCFGNVRRIVYTDKKPDGALIEMDNARSAMKARFVTRSQTIGGKPFNVMQLDPAKFKRASIGKEDKKSMDVTKAKENWRYAKDSKFMKICMARLKKLSPKVIVSNIPEGKEDMVKKHIIDAGYTVESMEGSSKADAPKTGFTMQVVDLATTEEAIGAVANLHNTWPENMGTKNKDKFGRERGLVFSFAGILKAEREKQKETKKAVKKEKK